MSLREKQKANMIGFEKKYFSLLHLCRRLLTNQITLSGFTELIRTNEDYEVEE
jgi:hypothetical protein